MSTLPTLDEDTINKIETLVGYVEALYKDIDPARRFSKWHFMPELIEEVETWLQEIKEAK